MPAIRFDDVSFHYESPFAPIFEGLSIRLDTTWRTALVGRNGRGKTTLLRLLLGELEPVRGAIEKPGAMRFFPFEVEQPARSVSEVVRGCVAPFTAWEAEMERLLEAGDEASLAEYALLLERYEREGGYQIDSRIERELAALGLGEEVLVRSFDSLSPGEQARALIGALFLGEEVFPLIDEPTNHLDLAGRERLGEYLATKPGYLLVSHDRHFLDLCCDHVVSIQRAEVRVTQGDFSTWKAQWEREQSREQREQERLKKDIRGLEAAARQRRGWSGKKEQQKIGAFDKGHIGHLAAKQMKRAQESERRRDRKLEEKKGLLKNVEKERKVRLRSEGKSPELVVSVDDVAVGKGEEPVLSGVSFRLERGERLAIVGPNGCGKTTLLDAIAGELPVLEGSIHRPGFLTVVRGYQTPRWERGLLREHLQQDGIDETLFRTTMGSLGVVGEIFDRVLETFSMGERKKVDLCRSFLAPAHLLLWDEPVNHIDLASREEIEEVILREQPTMLFVEHDRWFIERVATGVIELS